MLNADAERWNMNSALPQPSRASQRLLTPAEVIELLAITESHFRKLVFTKRLPTVRIGRLVRVRPGELEKWLASCSTPAQE